MHFAWIVDPIDTLNPKKDSSIAMMRAAANRGHSNTAIKAGSLTRHPGGIEGEGQPLLMQAGESWYRASAGKPQRLTAFDAVLMRQDPPFDLEYLYSTHLLSLAEAEGARVYNRPESLRNHNEKLAALRFPEWIPKTVVSRDPTVLRAFIREEGDTILKPLDGMGGQGIFRARHDDPNLSVILDTVTRFGTETVMAQEYLPAIRQGDKRVLLIHGEPCPFALARIPQAGETRGNLAAGGRGVAMPLTDTETQIAHAIGPYARAMGLLIVGLDIIGGRLTEFNVTSPTCMVEIFEQTGFNAAEAVIIALEKSVSGES